MDLYIKGGKLQNFSKKTKKVVAKIFFMFYTDFDFKDYACVAQLARATDS